MSVQGKHFHYLFKFKQRRNNLPVTAQEKMPYQYLPVLEMSPQDVDDEIKLRIKAMQNRGDIPVADASNYEKPNLVKSEQKKIEPYKFTQFIRRKQNAA